MQTEIIRTISPTTNEVIEVRHGAKIEDIHHVASASTLAFKSWKRSSLEERKNIVRRALEIVQERKEVLGQELTRQMGRPIAYSVKEIETMQKRADYLLDMAEESLSHIPGRKEDGFQRWLQREPLGPTLIVFAWNFPFLIIVNSLIPALLAGNTVVLKPSPQTPLIGERFVEIFSEAGLPVNVLQNLHSGDPVMLKRMVQIPDFQLITFTGSTRVGGELREATAKRFVQTNLELGGNDPAYVCADADLRYCAVQLVDGAVFNAGQSCCAVERIYVHASIHDEFVAELQQELKNYKLGNPFDESTNVGPVISKASQTAIIAQVTDAIQKGAKDVTPQNLSFESPPTAGNYVVPRILTNVDHSMTVLQEETFGPIIPVMKVKDDREAIKYMNDSHYGLTASVWTKDLVKGKDLIQVLDAGTVFVNRADYPSPDLAWTGWKASGMGCTLGPKAFDAFVKLKSFHVKENQR